MLTKTIEKVLRENREAWINPSVLVADVCRVYATMSNTDREPNYASIIRIAARLKSQARFRSVHRKFCSAEERERCIQFQENL